MDFSTEGWDWLGDWLKRRPVTYMVTHMAIMPLIDLYATGCDWLTHSSHGLRPPEGLLWFLLVSLFNGFVIEIGRKLRAGEIVLRLFEIRIEQKRLLKTLNRIVPTLLLKRDASQEI